MCMKFCVIYYIDTYSIRFAAPGGPTEWLKASFLRDGMLGIFLRRFLFMFSLFSFLNAFGYNFGAILAPF